MKCNGTKYLNCLIDVVFSLWQEHIVPCKIAFI